MTQASHDPIAEFQAWFNEAKETPLRDPTAMAVATSSPDGIPSVRMVLMKHFDHQGLVFYTNFTSAKARDLQQNSWASACFFWETTRKQVRVSGRVQVVSSAEADAYFASRPRDSQLGAWASLQSQVMNTRTDFEERFKQIQSLYEGQTVPRPEHWSGFRIIPEKIEFWIELPYRLHERWIYHREGQGWTKSLLYP
jgi:pyridoxamine 5'-phosphate oxidase